MSYEKGARGDRCLLQVDDGNVTSQPNEVFENLRMGNPRFRSAVRVLTDLGLLVQVDGVVTVTDDGHRLLCEELAKQISSADQA